MRKNVLKTFLIYLVILLVCIVVVFPIIWMISGSFKTPREIHFPGLRLIPRAPTLENYTEAFKSWPLFRWLYNSGVNALGITLGEVLVSILAGYGFGYFNFRGKNILFMMALGTMIVPFPATMIPNYILISSMGGINTYWGIILPRLAGGALGIFLIRQHVMSLPGTIFDAAKIDGANSWYVLWHIVVPLSKGVIVALIIIFGLGAWNMYFWPLLILTESEMQTVSVGLANFIDIEYGIEWGPLMAAVAIASSPALILYGIGQKHLMMSFSVRAGLKE